MKETIVFNHEGTGGNCTAYIHRYGENGEYEILLTDGDLTAPKDLNSFPIDVSYYINGYFKDGADAENMESLLSFVSKVLGREISEIRIEGGVA